MEVVDPRSGRTLFYYRWWTIKPGSKIWCGNAYYVNDDEVIRHYADLWKLETVT